MGVRLAKKGMDIRRQLMKYEIMDNLILNLRVNIPDIGLAEFEKIKIILA